MNRKEKMLRHINSKGQGMEIGPSYNPVAPKKEGFSVHIVDYTDRAGLIAKYTGHPVNLGNIEDVDFVWNGESYAQLTGHKKYYDWIIASHVIEHTPDLIGFLNDCDAVLKDDGVISLAVPDKRYCFDHFRPLTGISKIIDSHLLKNTIHTPGTAVEYYLNAVKKGESIGWRGLYTGAFSFAHSLEDARQVMQIIQQTGQYVDMHAWCFVPHSFRVLIQDLFDLGFIPFQEVDFFDTKGLEFFVTLGRKGKGTSLSRLKMLKKIEQELHKG